MDAVRTYGPGDLRLEDVPEPQIVETLPLTEALAAYQMFDAREATKVVLQP